MASKMSSEKDSRTRNWTFILYPESAPSNWIDMLNEYHIPFAVSPLHDSDIDGNGKPKKPHFHIVLTYQGKKSYEQVLEVTTALNAPIPKRVDSVRGLVRYFAHLDDPDKAQYSVNDIQCFGGFDAKDAFEISASARYKHIADMIVFVKTNHITEFQDLMDMAMIEHLDDWFPLLCDNSAFIIEKYISSQRNRAMRYHPAE